MLLFHPFAVAGFCLFCYFVVFGVCMGCLLVMQYTVLLSIVQLLVFGWYSVEKYNIFPVLVSLFEKPTQIARILYKAHRSDKLCHSVDEVPPNQRKQAFAGVCRCVVFFVCPCTSAGFRGKQPAPPRPYLMFAIFSDRHFWAIFGKCFQETGF